MKFDIIANLRKSVRSFTEQKLSEQQINELKETILKVPSAKSIFPWRCYFITNQEKIETLSKFKGSGSGFIKNAPLLVVITADTNLSDMWIEDCSIVGTYLLLKAVDMQLGACWVQVRNRQHDDTTSARRFIMDHVDIPESHGIASIIAIGYPKSEPEIRAPKSGMNHKFIDIQ